MAFQILCPQGHVLEADQSQAGQASACPFCGAAFLIPEPPRSPSAFPPPSLARADEGQEAFPDIRTTSDEGSSIKKSGKSRPSAVRRAADLDVVHIPCPAGHELETPREMLGRYALCPACQAKFWLRLNNSVEYRQEKSAEDKRRRARVERLWLRTAIVAAVLVVSGLGLLLLLSAMRGR